MTDMTAVIVPRSDQINADDLIPGPMTVTITDVKIRAGEEQPVSISLQGTPKVFRPCKSMSRVLVAAWGPDAKAYIGRSLTLYRDPKVKWGGMEVGGIRISHMSHIEREMVMMLTESKANRKPHKVRTLAAPTQEPDPALAEARAEARKGTQAFRDWWAANPAKRPIVAPITAELKALCDAADAPPTELDEFGLPRLSDGQQE